MRRSPLFLLALAALAAGCGNDNTWDGRYDVEGEWEVWTAESQNDCFMLAVGTSYYVALLEPGSGGVDYVFTGSDGGERCWTRNYTREGNGLFLEETSTVQVFVNADCEVLIHREREAVFSSSDTFSETSNVDVTWVSGDDCPVGSLPCEAKFVSLGVRCNDCWLGCDAAAMVRDPELDATSAERIGSR